MSNKWTVYKITSPEGRVYVGCTGKTLGERFKKGRGYKFIPDMYNDILNYGWSNFTKEVIYECFDEDEARQKEHEEIKRYPDGYNRYRGLKDRRTGRPVTKPKPVICLETGEVYSSIYRASKKTGLDKNKISYCCRGKRSRTGGLHWSFYPDNYTNEWRISELEKKRLIDSEAIKRQHEKLKKYKEPYVNPNGYRKWSDEAKSRNKGKNGKPVIQLSMDGEVIAEYASSVIAGETLGISHRKIRMVCNGERNKTGGFRWKWKNAV